jgi:hypothetical protein
VLEGGTDPSPYLSTWAEGGPARGEARIAFVVGLHDAPAVDGAGGARIDLWLSSSGSAAELPALAERAAALRERASLILRRTAEGPA